MCSSLLFTFVLSRVLPSMKRTFSKISICLILLLGLASGSLAQNNESWEEMTEQADDYFFREKYSLAIESYLKAYAIAKENYSDTSQQLYESIYSLGTAYWYNSEFDKAEDYYKLNVDFAEKKFGRQHVEYAYRMNDLATLQQSNKQYEKALPTQYEVLRLLEGLAQASNDDNAQAAYNLCVSFYHLNQLDSSILYGFKALEYFERSDSLSENYINCLKDVAVISEENKSWSEWYSCLQKKLEYYQSIGQRISLEYLNTLKQKSNLLERLNKQKSAVITDLEVLSLSKVMFGPSSREVALVYNNLGVLYKDLKQYPLAIKYYDSSLQLYKRLDRDGQLNYAIVKGNEAMVLKQMGDNAQAEQLIKESLVEMAEKQSADSMLYVNWQTRLGETLIAQSKYDEALINYQDVRGKIERKFGRGSKETITILAHISLTFQKKSQGDSALKYQMLSLDLVEKHLGKKHIRYSLGLNNLAGAYMHKGDYHKAIEYYEESAQLALELRGDKSADYAHRLVNLGNAYLELDQHQKASEALLTAKEILIATLGKKHARYSLVLTKLSLLYSDLGDYEKSMSYAREALEVAAATRGENSRTYAIRLSRIGQVYVYMGNANEGLKFFKQASALELELLGENHADYGLSLGNIADAFLKLGEYDSALVYREKSMAIVSGNYGQNHIKTAIQYQKISNIYTNLGHWKKALESINLAQDICSKTIGTNNNRYAEMLIEEGNILKRLNDKINALKQYVEAGKIIKELHGPKHLKYGYLMNQIALLYKAANMNEKALKYALAAKRVIGDILGDEHPNYGTVVVNLGTIYKSLKQYDSAEVYLFKALAIMEKVHGKLHPSYGNALNNIGSLYDVTNQNDSALKYFQRSLELAENNWGKEHDKYTTRLNNLANLYRKMGRDAEAKTAYLETNINYLKRMNHVFRFRTETEKKKYMANVQSYFKIYQSFAFDMQGKDAEINSINMNNQLILKGLLLNSSKGVLTNLRSLNDAAINQEISRLQTYYQKLADPELPENEEKLLREKVNATESKLVNIHSTRFGGNSIDLIDWKDIRSKLKEGEIAIEFVQFRYRASHRWSDSTFYVAYLIGSSFEDIKWIPLFEQGELQQILKQGSPNSLFTRGVKVRSNSAALGDQLYQLLWTKISTHLDGINTIYFSPDGLLHQIPFAALVNPEGNYLGERYNLVQLSSSSNLIDGLHKPVKKEALLLGGIDYNLAGKHLNSNNNTWSHLPGTQVEIQKLEEIFKKNGGKSESWSGQLASEERLKSLKNSPPVLHLATHGFFYQKQEADSDAQFSLINSKDPLLRSGLLLAGANYAWVHGSNPEATEDGILTALEISQLDLHNTDMVVLSACETGLGDIEGNEGVYGLQRAFKMAGVKVLVMSLWEVPDRETAQFMQLFYEQWLVGNTVRDAFVHAQRSMMSLYRDEPLKWAAFVLVE